MSARFVAIAVAIAAAAFACSDSSSKSNGAEPDEKENTPGETGDDDDDSVAPDASTDDTNDPLPGCTKDPGPPEQTVDAAAVKDPIGGAENFTLDMALAGYPEKTGVLTAAITTEKSVIRCELAEDAAPISVANFVGLARGTRPFKKAGKWKVGRFYDGLIWHRVIPDFVIQGGDPLGKGTGGPGYDLVEENHVDEPLGTLAMAASKAPSGSQFYVVVGQGPQANYNVFGSCSTEAAIEIAAVERDKNDKPLTDVHMKRIDIARCPAK